MRNLLLCLIFLLSGCVGGEKVTIKINEVKKKDKHLELDFSILNSQIKDFKELSSKKIVCQNLMNNSQRIEGYIVNFSKNNMVAEIEFCKNDDNRVCEPILIRQLNENTTLQCHLVLSAMLGTVNKSNNFNINLSEF